MITPVLSTVAAVPTWMTRHGFEVILRIINNPAQNAMKIFIFSAVVIVLPVTGTCYGIKKLYERHFPE
ncbi:MAG: hypothetical protein K0U13_00445 [Chlamydiae bacterium]|nr:hypothetical protein [Chlamydiota bacterium]